MLNQDYAFLHSLPEGCGRVSRVNGVQVRSEAYHGLRERGENGFSPSRATS